MALTKPPVLPAWAESGDKVQPSNAEIQTGWPLSNVPPARQRWNWLLNFLANGVRYLTRRGIADWGSDETYEIGDRVQGPDGLTYKALTQNTNKTPASNPSDWTRWGFTASELGTELNKLDAKASCRVATTANLGALSGLLTIDGVTLVAGDRVLVKDQTTGSQNGIYVAAAGAWSRATDADDGTKLTSGATVPVEEGTANADTLFMLTADGVITIGITALVFAAVNGNVGTAGTYNSVTVDAKGRVISGSNLSSLVHGQCRLAKSGANLVLSPFSGNKLIINGAAQTVPSAGVSLAATGLTVSALYYIYAYMNAGTMTLEASATGHSTDATTGVEIKTGDATRTLVGMARPITGPAWQDTAAQRFVRSWFNEPSKNVFNYFTSDKSTASSTSVEVGSASERCEFLSWANENCSFFTAGSFYNSSGGNNDAYMTAGLDITSIAGSPINTTNYALTGGIAGVSAGVYSHAPAALSGNQVLTEGYHFMTILGCQISGGTAVWKVDTNLNLLITR